MSNSVRVRVRGNDVLGSQSRDGVVLLVQVGGLGEVGVLVVTVTSTMLGPFVIQESLGVGVETDPVGVHVSLGGRGEVGVGEVSGSTVLGVAANVAFQTRGPETVEVEVFGVEVTHVGRSALVGLADSTGPFSFESEIGVRANFTSSDIGVGLALLEVVGLVHLEGEQGASGNQGSE